MAKDNTLAILSHILALFTWFVGPLIVFLAAKDPNPRENARNALNWQISLTIYFLVCIPLILIFVGLLLIWILVLLNLIFCIMAAVKAGNKEAWRYPLSLDLVK